MDTLYKIQFFVPIDACESVKKSMFNAGAGKIGNYDQCSFETKGIGQFCPQNGANPFLGNVGSIEKVEELRVEMICEADKVKTSIEALKKSHPYEEVAFDIIKLSNHEFV
jgi:hypothetical protein